MNDTQIVEQLLDELGIKTREDLIYWIENFSEGYECDHYYGMVSDTEGYRIETEEEKEEKRARLHEHDKRMRSRWEAGDRSMDMLMWKTMDSYTQMLTDQVLNTKPLLFQLMENNSD